MNGRCIILAIWILVAVPKVFSDSFPSHPAVTEMEATVMLGTECVRGVNERCQATQYATNPVQYQIAPPFVKTNDAGWYLDQGLMVALASNIMSLVPYYVGTNSVYDGTAMTFTGLLASLHLGDGTNFTATPCWTNNVGQTNCTTNAATFGPWAWRNYVVAWQERYKVVCMLSNTIATPLVTGLTMYHGEGKGETWEDAYAAAVSSYSNVPVTDGYPLDQHCKGILWSNYYSHTCANDQILAYGRAEIG